MLVSIEKSKLILKKWVRVVSALETEVLGWPVRKNQGPVERLRPEPAFYCRDPPSLKERDRPGWGE